MIKKILILVSVLLILIGGMGTKSKAVAGKMLFLCHSVIGVMMLSFVKWNEYALIGGIFQLVFRLVGLFFFVSLLLIICKKNEVKDVRDIDGIGRAMPYVYLALVIFSALVIGVPLTGTFTGMLYSGMSYVVDGMEQFDYIGLIGNFIGFIIPAAIIFPILKSLYFPVKGTEEKKVVVPGKGIVLLYLVVAFILMAFCIYQKPVLLIAQKAMERILD